MREDLIYDWNHEGGRFNTSLTREIHLDDETLRDGLQCPSVKSPTIEDKIKILHKMAEVGIDSADLGLPGAGPQVVEDVTMLAKEIRNAKLAIEPNCAARTVHADIDPVARISEKVGYPIEVSTFLGSSPIRQYAEGWDMDRLLKITEDAVSHAVQLGLPVMYVTEDTTRAHPDDISKLYKTAIECGARRICIADTAGHALPEGTKAIVSFIHNVVKESGEDVKIDWHGHEDRGMGVINCLSALEAGADRVHGCILGIGERVGNASMDILLVNLKMKGLWQKDLSKLKDYVEFVSKITGISIPRSYPVFGSDAFRTATGVHASAILKATNKGDKEIADLVYSSVPASLFGLKQTVEVGPMSGESNVRFWLKERGYEEKPEIIKAILKLAKSSSRVLTDVEIKKVIEIHES